MERWRIGLTADLRIGSTTLRLETVARVGAADRETAVGHDLERAAAGTTLTKSETFSASNFRGRRLQNPMPNLPIFETCPVQNSIPHYPKVVT